MLRPLAILYLLCFVARVSFGQGSPYANLSFYHFLDSISTNAYIPYINERIHAADAAKQLYEKNRYRYFWSNTNLSGAVLFELQNASTHGLLSEDYHKTAIQRLKLINGLSENEIKMFTDVLLTDGLLLYFHHLRNGKINPHSLTPTLSSLDPDPLIEELTEGRISINGRQLLRNVQRYIPNFPIYRMLYNARADWVQKILDGGGQPCLDQIATIDVNLERLRWGPDKTEKRFLLINVAGFRLFLLENDIVTWETKVIVGNCDTPTPWISSHVEYVVFNPTWTVPTSIIEDDILPRVKRDVDYLTRNSYYLTDASGALLDPTLINWSSFNMDSLDFKIVQSPGPGNALGRVKFVFPNDQSIYMHDTPNKSLFNKQVRTFSHGCIRVEHPLELARLLLNDDVLYSEAAIDEIVSTGETRTITLNPPGQIMLTYLTVSIDANGQVLYHDDVYKLDNSLLRLLKQPIQ